MKKANYLYTGFFLCLLIAAPAVAQGGWQLLNSGIFSNLNAVQFLNPDTGFVAGEGGTVLSTMDAGSTWNALQLPQTTDLYALYFLNPDTGLVAGDGGVILRTTDGGQNWTAIPSGISDPIFSMDFFGSKGIAGALSQSLIYSGDGGASWQVAQSGFFGGGFWGAVMLSPSIGFVGGENSIFQPLVGTTTTGGLSWSWNIFYINGNEGKILGLEFTDQFTGYAACRVWDGRGAISKTTDGGSNWSHQFFNLPLNDVEFPISNASLIGFAVGEGGSILKTVDAGQNWQAQVSGVAVTLKAASFLDLDHGFVVGQGGTVLKTTTGGEPPSGLEQPGKSGPAAKFELFQNYPNPFNPETKIDFYLPHATDVSLTIMDIQGRVVHRLLNGRVGAGHQQVQWHGRDSEGNSLPSGLYFYRLQTQDGQRVRKMFLIH